MSNIQIQDVNQRVQYTATASQTIFTVPFPFLANSDLVVYQNSTKLDLGSSPGEYGVSGAGNPSGGTVTLVTGATVNDIITIYGNQPIDRTSIYSATISNLTGSDLNNDFNREIIMLKQLYTTQNLMQLTYQPYAQVSQDETVTRDRWLPRLGAGQTWRMNAAGTGFEAIDFDAGGGGAPTDAKYILAEADGSLPSGVNLGALTTGLLKHTVSAGVSTPQTAVNGTDYWAPGDDLTRASAPTSGSDVTNKTYVDALINGLTFLNPVRVASTANFTSTYSNGSSGVGATLTATSNGAASIDGVSLSLNDRVLFKDQSTTYENGIYYVSQVGDGSNPAIYTRTTDFDQPSEIQPGDLVNVREGTANAETFWIQTATVNTIGTDAINFNLFGNNSNNVMTLTGSQTATGQKTFDDLVLGGDMDANSNQINNVTDPTSAQDAATKNYVDSQFSVSSFPYYYINGLKLSNDTDTDHDIQIAVGQATDSTNSANMVLANVLTKQIDANWSAGDNAGGFPSGLTLSNNTWYHMFLIKNPTTGVVDAGFDTSTSAANLLTDATGYTLYRRIGSVLTNGSANIVQFLQIDNMFLWVTPPEDVNSTVTTSDAAYTLSIPPDYRCIAIINFLAFKSANNPSIYMYTSGITSANPTGTVGGGSPLATMRHTTPSTTMGFMAFIPSNTSKQIQARSNIATSSFGIATLGWQDFRGQNNM